MDHRASQTLFDGNYPLVRRLQKFFLLSYISIASASAAIITPALPAIKQYFQLSNHRTDMVITIFLLGYMIGQLFYGPIAKRYGRLRALIFGLWVNLFGIGLCLLGAYTQCYKCLLLGRLVTAIGSAAGLCCTFMLINVLMSEREAKQAFSLSVLSFTLGIGLSVLLGGVLTEYLSWPYCFWLLMIHGGVVLISAYFFKDAPYEAQAINLRNIWLNYRQALQNRNLVIYALILGACPMTSYTYSAAAPFIAIQTLHLTPSTYGFWNSLNMVGMLAGSFASVWAMQRYLMVSIVKCALLGLALCTASLWWMAYVHSDSAWWFFSSMSMTYFVGALIFPCASYLASHAIKDGSSASSMMSFISIATGMVGVSFMGAFFANQFNALNVTWLIYAMVIVSLWRLRK